MLQQLDPTFDPARIRLLVYDLDGTLVDAFEDIWNGVNHAMRGAKLPELPLAQVRSYVGDGAQMLIQRCLGDRHADRFGEVYPLFRAYYIANPQPTAHCYPGVLETLELLRERGYRQAILSNKPHEVTLHTCGGLEMMKAAEAAAQTTASQAGRDRPPLVLGVTVLTSMDTNELARVGVGASVGHQVERLASLAVEAGLRGLVCSPLELAMLRSFLPAQFQLITPGIRGPGEALGDQKRTLSAREAVDAGADWLVIGRPITAAPDPRAAAERILASLR